MLAVWRSKLIHKSHSPSQLESMLTDDLLAQRNRHASSLQPLAQPTTAATTAATQQHLPTAHQPFLPAKSEPSAAHVTAR